jgi:hypothetical protein
MPMSFPMSTPERMALCCKNVRSNVKTTELWSSNAGAIDLVSHHLENPRFYPTDDT